MVNGKDCIYAFRCHYYIFCCCNKIASQILHNSVDEGRDVKWFCIVGVLLCWKLGQKSARDVHRNMDLCQLHTSQIIWEYLYKYFWLQPMHYLWLTTVHSQHFIYSGTEDLERLFRPFINVFTRGCHIKRVLICWRWLFPPVTCL